MSHRRNIGLSHFNPHAWPKPERRVDVYAPAPFIVVPTWFWVLGLAFIAAGVVIAEVVR